MAMGPWAMMGEVPRASRVPRESDHEPIAVPSGVDDRTVEYRGEEARTEAEEAIVTRSANMIIQHLLTLFTHLQHDLTQQPA